MGATKEWVEVLFAAVFWGGSMLLFRRTEGKIPKLVVLIYALGALLFGLVTIFGYKRAFSFPLIILTLGIIAAVFLIGRLSRPSLKPLP